MTIEQNPTTIFYRIGKIRPAFITVGFFVSMVALGIVGYDEQWYMAAEEGSTPSGTPFLELGNSYIAMYVFQALFVVMLAIIGLGIAGYISRRHYRKVSERLI